MTGNKQNGDERLRTPMHWSRKAAAGFTTGQPWEPLAPDSFTANVEVLESDRNSLLHLHRKIIHLRTSEPALANGQFVPLTTSNAGALAYLRRTNDQTVLVLANLTSQPLAGVELSGGGGTLTAGRYALTALHGDVAAGTLRVAGNGQVRRWIPVRTIAPMQTYIIRLAR